MQYLMEGNYNKVFKKKIFCRTFTTFLTPPRLCNSNIVFAITLSPCLILLHQSIFIFWTVSRKLIRNCTQGCTISWPYKFKAVIYCEIIIFRTDLNSIVCSKVLFIYLFYLFQVFLARGNVPADNYHFFMNILLDTLR